MSLDTFLLSKDTKVFVLHEGTTAERMVDSHRITKTVNSFERYGYKCNLQPYPSTDKIIEDPELHYGIKRLPLDLEKLGTLKIKQWYGFLNVIRKARVLDKGFIVTFAGCELIKDVGNFPPPLAVRASVSTHIPYMYRWSSQKENLSICRNYYVFPDSVDLLFKEWIYKLSYVSVDIHYFFTKLPVCPTLDVDLEFPSL
jgi:hypothetical protein